MKLKFQDLQKMQIVKTDETKFVFNEQTSQTIEFINLSGNKKLKEIVFDAPQESLKYLDASNCSIEKITFSQPCKNLQSIDLHANKLVQVNFTAEFQSLELINLNKNPNFKELIIEKEISSLRYLYLYECDIRNLQDLSVYFIKHLEDFSIRKNKNIQSPPVEIVEQGKDAVKRYFDLLKKEAAKGEKPKYLFEAKIIVVGEQEVGKSSFIAKIKDKNAKLPEKDERTPGIVVETINFLINKTKFKHLKDLSQNDFLVNIWDFGGQKIYHGTHQIFFGKDIFYVFVGESKEEINNFSYWFNTIEQLGGSNAHVFLLLNKKYGYPFKFSFNKYKKRFTFINTNSIKEIDLKQDIDKIEELKSLIETRLQEMPKIGSEISATFVKIREDLKKEKENFITLGKFRGICETRGLKEYKDIEMVSKYLDTIGAITHFIDNDELKNLVFTKPDWLVKTLYKILHDETVIKKRGVISEKDIKSIWKQENLEFEKGDLAKLMNEFGLMYKVIKKDRYVIPEHLPNDIDCNWSHNNGNLLRFNYQFDKYMPEGIMPRLIVLLHDIIDNEEVWRNGVHLIYKDKTFAKIEKLENVANIFEIRIAGQEQKELLAVIKNNFEYIFKLFEKLNYEELVPCICSECTNNKNLYFFEYSYLLKKKVKGSPEAECKNSIKNVNVIELLDGVTSIDKMGLFKDIREGSGQKKPKRITELNGKQKREFKEALMEAFPKYGKLKIFIDEEFEKQLNRIVPDTVDLEEVTYELITSWAIPNNLIHDLIKISTKRSNNNKILKFHNKIMAI